jgi:hypothetical protein
VIWKRRSRAFASAPRAGDGRRRCCRTAETLRGRARSQRRRNGGLPGGYWRVCGSRGSRGAERHGRRRRWTTPGSISA